MMALSQPYQLPLSMHFEVLFGLFFGILMGFLYSDITIKLLMTRRFPFIMKMPINFLTRLLGSLTIIGLIGILIPPFLASRKDISKILKTD